MLRTLKWFAAGALVAALALPAASSAIAEDLLTKSCPQLIRMAQSYQQDLKTVDTVLGSAIDAGTMQRIKKYKLKKASVRNKLTQVMKAIEVKGCVGSQ